MRFDGYDTPEELVDQLFSLLPSDFSPARCLEPCAGLGSLANGIVARWPKCRLTLIDIHQPTVNELDSSFLSAQVYCSDFLTEPTLKLGKYDLAVVNPPFSITGAATVSVEVLGNVFESSPAAAFALKALASVVSGGYLVAVLPDSVFSSEKDREARKALALLGSFFALESIGKFPGCSAHVKLAVLKRNTSMALEYNELGTPKQMPVPLAGQLFRGGLPVFKSRRKKYGVGVTYVHSTDLCHSDWIYAVDGPCRIIVGPAVLFPRVGALTAQHIVGLRKEFSIALSDCVFALKYESEEDVQAMIRGLRRRFSEFRRLYAGTGAPYTTISRLNPFLRLVESETLSRKINRGSDLSSGEMRWGNAETPTNQKQLLVTLRDHPKLTLIART